MPEATDGRLRELELVGGSGERRTRSGDGLTGIKRRRLNAATEIRSMRTTRPDYIHSALANVYLPMRDPGERRVWYRTNGAVSMRIAAGSIEDTVQPAGWRDLGLPWGSRARLILIYLTTEARRTGSPCVEVGASMLAFMRRLGLDGRGRDYADIRDQLQRLAVAQIAMAFPGDGGRRQVNGPLIEEMPLWSATDAQTHRLLWQEEVVLSERFFRTVMAHAVPLDERAIAALKNSPLGLDVYAWMASRLCRIEDGRVDFVPWDALKGQFGQEFGRLRRFRQAFREVLERVLAFYAEAAPSVSDGEAGLTLRHAPPPVLPRQRLRFTKGEETLLQGTDRTATRT